MTTARERARSAALMRAVHDDSHWGWNDPNNKEKGYFVRPGLIVEGAADAASDIWKRLVADLIDLAEHGCQDSHTGEYCVMCEAALQRAKEALGNDDRP